MTRGAGLRIGIKATWTCALLACAASWSPAAHAAVSIAWDCYLPDAAVTCRALEAAFFSNGAFVRSEGDAADPSKPDGPRASIHVRSVRIADGAAYSIDVHGVGGENISITDRVPRGFSHDAVLLRLVGVLQKATAPLFVVEEPAAREGDLLRLSLRDPSAGPRSARKDDDTTGWYVAPQLGFNGNRWGLTELHGWGNVELNWSHPAWRLRGWAWGNYRLVLAEPVTGDERPEDLRYENVDLGTDWTVVRSFGSVSLAANAYVIREPQANFDFKAGTWVGVEYVLVPFLKTDEGNVGAQYVFGVEHHDYLRETASSRMTYDYLRHRASVRAAWHFSRVDLDGRVSATSHLTDIRFSSVSGYGGVTWRVLDDLSLSANGEVSYRHALLNEPKDLSALHPLEQFYGGGAYGDVTFWTSVSISYVFGNSLINRQDQRWR